MLEQTNIKMMVNTKWNTSLSGLLIRPKCYKFRFRGHDFASTSLLALSVNI